MLSRFSIGKRISIQNVRYLCSVINEATIPVINVEQLKPEKETQNKSKNGANNAKPKPKPNQYKMEQKVHTDALLSEKSGQESKKQFPQKPKKIKALPVNLKNSDELSSEDQNPKNTKQSTHIKNLKKPIIDQKFLYITGLSKFISRRDLQLILGKHKPCTIDPILEHGHQLLGAYMLKFSTTEELNSFKKFATKGLRNKTTLGAAYKVKGVQWLEENPNLVRASSARITNKTLRVESTQRDMHSKHVLNLFEDYGICKKDIYIRYNSQGRYFLVYFRTPEDAERAQVELDRSEFQHYQLSITSYDC